MPDCHASAAQFLSERWVLLARMVWGVSQIDQMRLAKYSLQQAIAEIEGSEAGIRQELMTIARKVRQMDRATMKNATLQHVKRSRYLRQQLGAMASKRGALERHLDTLSSSELNQQVINSVKQTSSALKSMGLGDALKQADGLQLDMEEQISDIHSMQKALATPLYDDFDDLGDGLEAELDLLLKDSEDEITACMFVPPTPVATVNSMEGPRGSEPAAKAPAAAEQAEAPAAAEKAEAPAAAEKAEAPAAAEKAEAPAAAEKAEAPAAAEKGAREGLKDDSAPDGRKKTGRKAGKGKQTLERVEEDEAGQSMHA